MVGQRELSFPLGSGEEMVPHVWGPVCGEKLKVWPLGGIRGRRGDCPVVACFFFFLEETTQGPGARTACVGWINRRRLGDPRRARKLLRRVWFCPRRRFAAVPLCLSAAGNSSFYGEDRTWVEPAQGRAGQGWAGRFVGPPVPPQPQDRSSAAPDSPWRCHDGVVSSRAPGPKTTRLQDCVGRPGPPRTPPPVPNLVPRRPEE